MKERAKNAALLAALAVTWTIMTVVDWFSDERTDWELL